MATNGATDGGNGDGLRTNLALLALALVVALACGNKAEPGGPSQVGANGGAAGTLSNGGGRAGAEAAGGTPATAGTGAVGGSAAGASGGQSAAGASGTGGGAGGFGAMSGIGGEAAGGVTGSGGRGGAGIGGQGGAGGMPAMSSTLVNTYDGARATTVSFDLGWKFHLGDASGAQSPTFDDSSWTALALPHDWSISLPFNQNSPAGSGGGYLDGGVGWYRKTFTLPDSSSGKRVFVQFDGVYMDSTVWLNGTQVCARPYG